MANSTNLILPFIEAAQAQKHVTHNEAILGLDAIVQLMVLDRDLTAPPGSPSDGDRYLVKATATGDWAGQENNIAARQDGVWKFYTPREGWIAWVADEDKALVYDGSAWGDLTTGGGGASLASCQAKLSAAQSIANGTVTVLNFDAENWDTDGMHDNSTNNSRITAKTAGKYAVMMNAVFAGNDTGGRQILLRLNGTTALGSVLMANNGLGEDQNMYLFATDLAVNDYLEMQVWQNSGGNLNVGPQGTFFTVAKVDD